MELGVDYCYHVIIDKGRLVSVVGHGLFWDYGVSGVGCRLISTEQTAPLNLGNLSSIRSGNHAPPWAVSKGSHFRGRTLSRPLGKSRFLTGALTRPTSRLNTPSPHLPPAVSRRVTLTFLHSERQTLFRTPFASQRRSYNQHCQGQTADAHRGCRMVKYVKR